MSDSQEIASIPLRRDSVDVGVLLELTTEVMQRQARALGVDLRIRIDEDVPDVVQLDRDKVAWVITNLVGSALRHVRGPGGSVSVHVSYDVVQSRLSITVRDNGPGISADRVSRLLTRGSWRPGAALALLLIEDIAVAHGGAVEIRSNAERFGHFTEIRFTIPACRDGEARRVPSSES
jgi:signal transduction histidine kinase